MADMTDEAVNKAKERANGVLGGCVLVSLLLFLLAQGACVVWLWRHALAG